jgi:hypothetical protein
MSDDPEVGSVEWLQATMGMSEEEATHWQARLGQAFVRLIMEHEAEQAREAMVSPAEFAMRVLEPYWLYAEKGDQEGFFERLRVHEPAWYEDLMKSDDPSDGDEV